MQDIKVGRYGQGDVPGYGGWVEDHDATWIIYLDEHGKPSVMWTKRGADGGVIGEGIELAA